MSEIQTKISIRQRLPNVCFTEMLPTLSRDKFKKCYTAKNYGRLDQCICQLYFQFRVCVDTTCIF